MSYVKWYCTRYGQDGGEASNCDTFSHWKRVDVLAALIDKSSHRSRHVKIHAYAQDCMPPHQEIMKHAGAPESDMLHAINLIRRGVDGKSTRYDSITQYDLGHVTGLHFAVHLCLIKQATVAESILDAILAIEYKDLRDFAFYCHGGTHRSVGCACLLLMMVYPQGKLVLTTERTQRDASAYGCWSE